MLFGWLRRKAAVNNYILNDDGDPVPEPDLLKWEAWFGDTAKRRLARTEIGGGVFVSTVFLGTDHGWGSGKPVLWETMVFGGPLNEEQVRYHTRAEALAGHEEMVKRAREALTTSNGVNGVNG
jgi:hypothetical protein